MSEQRAVRTKRVNHRVRRCKLVVFAAAGTMALAMLVASPARAMASGSRRRSASTSGLLVPEGNPLGIGINVTVEVGQQGASVNVDVNGGNQAQANVDANLLTPDGLAGASASATVGQVDAVVEANVLRGDTILGACADVGFSAPAACAAGGSLLQASAADGLLGTQTTALVDGLLGACLEVSLGGPSMCATQGGPDADPPDPIAPPTTQPPASDTPVGDQGGGRSGEVVLVPTGDGDAAGDRASAAVRSGGPPGVLAFTGDHTTELAAVGAGLAGVGAFLSYARRRPPTFATADEAVEAA